MVVWTTEGIKGLVGTDEDPGVLHCTRSPKIVMISPYFQANPGHPILFYEKAQWLAFLIEQTLYPDGFTIGENQRTLMHKYMFRVPGEDEAEHGETGRVVMEATPFNHVERTSFRKYRKVGRFRLFTDYKHEFDVDFTTDLTGAWRANRRRDSSKDEDDDCDRWGHSKNDDNRKKLCSPETCKEDRCPFGDKRRDWAVVSKYECPAIPTKTVSELSGPTESGYYNVVPSIKNILPPIKTDPPGPVKTNDGGKKRADLIE
ncbi:uncharacterized protein BDV14DRAFT_203076 [Aspergillus stella-maris]|uniref:uncharacterized protein n=1 Tax=Aspergillus stella-maris TaxID=1810926 RepID=UPI003CCD0FE3